MSSTNWGVRWEERVRLAGQVARREGEVLFVTPDERGASALARWGLAAIVRPEDGVWDSALGALTGCDIVVVHYGRWDSARANRDARVLAGVARRTGVLIPGGSAGEGPARDLHEYVRHCESLNIGVRALVSEALVCLGRPPLRIEAGSAEVEWPPLRLGDLPPVEPFPVEVLPKPLAGFVEEAAQAAGAPVDFTGLAVLVTAGAVIGESLALMLKSDVGVSAALQGLNVGDPSAGGAAALQVVTRALGEVAPYTLVDGSDAALRRKLGENKRGILITRDEATAWVASLCAPRRGDRRVNGDLWREVLFGVRGRERTPFLAFCGNVPPVGLGALTRVGGSGVVERLLFVFPDPVPKPYWSEGGVGAASKDAWTRALKQLRVRKPIGGRFDPAVPRHVTLSAAAKKEWVAWYNARTDEMNAPDFNPAERPVEVQLRDTAAQLALIVHLLHEACGPSSAQSSRESVPTVEVEALRGALQLWSYFRSQHRRVRGFIAGGAGHSVAEAILGWVKRTRRQRFSVSELTESLRWLTERPGEPAASLRLLEDRQALRRHPEPPRPAGIPGRKPSPLFDVHPALVPQIAETVQLSIEEGNKSDLSEIS